MLPIKWDLKIHGGALGGLGGVCVQRHAAHGADGMLCPCCHIHMCNPALLVEGLRRYGVRHLGDRSASDAELGWRLQVESGRRDVGLQEEG